jgi:ATP synthase protein I
MARGIMGRRAGRSVGGLVLWELVKLALTGAMLVTAPMWVKPLDWPALLVTLVLCLKVYGVVLFAEQRRQKKSS